MAWLLLEYHRPKSKLKKKKNPQAWEEEKYIQELDESAWQNEMKQSKAFRLKI